MDKKSQPIKRHQKPWSTGVLLTNLGTPDAPTPKAIRKFLAEFLSDPRVIQKNGPLWQMILWSFILPFRPKAVAKQYKAIWADHGSPLLVNSVEQAKSIQEKLTLTLHTPIHVELAMRYGSPSIVNALARLRAKQINQLLILPLYPQYAAATVASTFDVVAKVIKTWSYLPTVQMISGYADHPGYISALCHSITDYWREHGRSKVVVFSYHGLPKKSLNQGDPYYCFCQKTTRLLAEKLKLSEAQYRIAFQSRFGKMEWLQPYCTDVLKDLAQARVEVVDIICPGFPADCLETLYEVQEEYAQLFIQAGGKNLRYIPALNAQPQHIDFLVELLKSYGVE